jgi:hypothetical protein
MTAIRKFNNYCEKLETLYKPGWSIPIPQALPTELAKLRDCPHFMEDVWITPSTGQVPCWLDDLNVREGIHAMLKADRCLEEHRRLGIEADNICHWFGKELAAVEVAIRTSSNQALLILLQQHQVRILHLKSRWSNPLASDLHFETHINTAKAIAESLAGGLLQSQPLIWTQPVVMEVDVQEEDDDDNVTHLFVQEDQPLIADILIADMFDSDMDDDDEQQDILDDDTETKVGLQVGLRKIPEMLWELPVSILGHFYSPADCFQMDLQTDDSLVEVIRRTVVLDYPRICTSLSASKGYTTWGYL